MKKLFLLLVAAISLLVVACEYDDTALKESIAKLEQRLDAVEAVQRAYENNLFIKGIQQIDNGYIITFSDNSTATIVNGDDGKDGADGADGADGKDGKDGKDGEDGKNGTNGKDGDTLIKSITIGKDSVTFVLTDGRKFTIAIYASLSVSFGVDEHTCISPNTTFKINYEVESNIANTVIDVVSSSDLFAFVSDAYAKSGQIEVTVGNTIDPHSKIIVFVSNGEKTIMRRLTFEEAALQVADESMKTLPIEGGEVTFEYLSNVDCEVVIPSSAKNWLSVVSPTRALETKSVTLKATANSEKPRSAIVSIKYAIGGLELQYTIQQDGIITSLGYTTNNGKPLDPYTTEGFGVTFLENNYDATTGKGTLVFNGRPTKIPDNAFVSCKNLTWIDIPICIKEIGNKAFKGCSAMEEITIPSSITSIGLSSFEGCGGKVTISCRIPNTPSGWKSEEGDFYKAAFTEVIIADSITSIGDNAFSECSKLTSVTIPDSVTEIGRSAFDGCTSLTSITIPDSVTSIGGWAFEGCSSLTNVTINSNKITYLSSSLFNGSGITSFVIPDGVKRIADSCFTNCTNLRSITIPTSVTEFNQSSFDGCTAIEEIHYKGDISSWCKIYFPALFENGLLRKCGNPLQFGGKLYINGEVVTDINTELTTPINSGAFFGYTSLNSIVIPENTTVINSYTFYGCTGLKSIVIPNKVLKINGYAFCSCSALTDVTIGSRVSDIGESAFSGCSSLTSVIIPDIVTSIGQKAFEDCTSLTSITIPDSVTSIGQWAFIDCSSLTSATIGNSVTSIGGYAFRYCSSLTSVYCKPTTPPVGSSGMFDRNVSGHKIYVPTASVDEYKSAAYWSDYASDIVGYVF